MTEQTIPAAVVRRRWRPSRVDVALSLLSALIEAVGLSYLVYKKGWFRFRA